MGLKRQLQTEIDRCLKRVSEAQADFQELWLKLEQMEQAPKTVKLDVPAPQYSHACNKDAAAREKLLSELKKHLKRMQRLREQIRTWLMTPETKDARGLPEARRAIEVDMERFKVCEKQNKTKAYSKVGLQREEKIDPASIAREDCTEWLNSVVAKLEAQVEENEAEIEEIAAGEGSRGRKPANPSPRAEELMSFIDRHRSHIVRLEQVLRLVGNEQVAPVDVEDSLRDGLEYYLESSMDTDFQQDDDDLFASIPLLAVVDENIGKIVTPTSERYRSPAGVDPFEDADEKVPPSVPETAPIPTSDGKPARQTKSAKRAARAAATADAAAARKSRTAPSSPKTPPGQPPKVAASVTPSTGEPHTPPPKAAAWSFGSAAIAMQVAQKSTASTGPPFLQHQDGRLTASTPPKTPSSIALQPQSQPRHVPNDTIVGDLQSALRRQQHTAPPAPVQPPVLEEAQAHAARHAQPQRPPESESQRQHDSSGLSDSSPVSLPPPSAVRAMEGIEGPTPAVTFTQALQSPSLPFSEDSQPVMMLSGKELSRRESSAFNPGVVPVHSHAGSLPAQWASHRSADAADPPVPRVIMRPPASAEDPGISSDCIAMLEASSAAAAQVPVLQHHSLFQEVDDCADGDGRGEGIQPPSSVDQQTPWPASHRFPAISSTDRASSVSESADREPCASPAEGQLLPSMQPPLVDSAANAAHLTSPLLGAALPSVSAELREDMLASVDAAARFGPTNCDADWPTSGSALRPPKVLQPPLNYHASRNLLLLPNARLPALQQPATFSRLSEDTLFFAFYFQQGLIQKLYAAEELRRRGFVFHKELLCWFKNAGQLLKGTQTLEQGSFEYFDYELRNSPNGKHLSGWTKRTTQPDFEFHHKHMCNGRAPESAA